MESGSDGSEDDIKECSEMEADNDAKPSALLSVHKSPLNLSSNCSLLNLQIIQPPCLPSGLLSPTTPTSSGAQSNNCSMSTPFTFPAQPGNRDQRHQ